MSGRWDLLLYALVIEITCTIHERDEDQACCRDLNPLSPLIIFHRRQCNHFTNHITLSHQLLFGCKTAPFILWTRSSISSVNFAVDMIS